MTNTARKWITDNPLITAIIVMLISGSVIGLQGYATLRAEQAYMKSDFKEHKAAQLVQSEKAEQNIQELSERSAIIQTKVERIEIDISEIKRDIKELLRSRYEPTKTYSHSPLSR